MKQRSGDDDASACQTIFIRAQVASQDKLFGLLNQPDEIAISYPSRFVNAFPTTTQFTKKIENDRTLDWFFLLFPSSVHGGGHVLGVHGCVTVHGLSRRRPSRAGAPERDDRALRAAMVDVVIEDARGHTMSGSAADFTVEAAGLVARRMVALTR